MIIGSMCMQNTVSGTIIIMVEPPNKTTWNRTLCLLFGGGPLFGETIIRASTVHQAIDLRYYA